MEQVPLASVEMGSLLSAEEPMGTIAIPIRDSVHVSTMLSLLGTDFSGLGVDKVFVRGNVLALQRNALISRMRGDWILFIDGDMSWQPDAVKRLLATKDELEARGEEVDVLGALCFGRDHPYKPTLYMGTQSNQGPYNFIESWDTDLVEVDATGMAFCLITRKALERIAGTPMPSYEERKAHTRHPDFFRWYGAVGEDIRFCQDVRAAGGRIVVDTRIEIGHVSEIQVTKREFLLAIVNRGEEAESIRREINDRMGLPTMTADEARAKLIEMM